MNAVFVARATDRQCSSISSISTSLVSSIPRATMAKLSPTSIMSMPAWSATCALGKSWAVIMVMGSFLRYRLWRVLRVTGLRAWAGGVPRGEWELQRTWATGSTAGDSDDDKAACRQALRAGTRKAFMVVGARDSVGGSWWEVDLPRRGFAVGGARGIGDQACQPWPWAGGGAFIEAVMVFAQ